MSYLFSEVSEFQQLKCYVQMYHFTSIFFLNAMIATEILDLLWRVHLASSDIMLCKQLKYSTFSTCFWAVITYDGDRSHEILITIVFFTLISIKHGELLEHNCGSYG
jgi:hypothetical protein